MSQASSFMKISVSKLRWGSPPPWLMAGMLVSLSFAAANSNAEELPALEKATAEKISFRQDVWPIMKRHCWGCHSGANPKGGLSFDTVADMLAGGDSGPLFEAHKPDESLLIDMIIGQEPEMPQKQPPLSQAKIHILRQWIFAGANDDSVSGESGLAVLIPKTYQFAPAVTSVAISPDGTLLAAACRSEVVLIDPQGKVPPRRLPTESDLLTHVEFSPDGALVVAVGGSPARFGEVRFFQTTDGRLVSSRRIGHDTLFRGDFAPDGKSIALGGPDGSVHIVPVNQKHKLRSFGLHSDWVLDVTFTPDGKMIVTGGRDKSIKICSVETGRLLRTIDGSTELIGSVAADGQFAVAAGRARTLIGYELKTALSGVEVGGPANSMRPISKRNQYAKSFETQPGEILDLATSGDSKLLAVAGSYGEVRVYNIENRKRLATLKDVPAPVYCVALNQDGTRLVLGSKTGQVQVYELPTGKLLISLTPVPVATVATK